MNQLFIDRCVAAVGENAQRVAFPEATEEKILKAAELAAKTGAVKPVLVGDPAEITAAAASFGVNIEGWEIASNLVEEEVQAVIAAFYAKNDLMSIKALNRRIKDPVCYAFMMLAVDKVDCVFAGLSHTTGEIILHASTYLGLKEGITAASSMGIADIPGYDGEYGTMLAIADSAVNVDPGPEALADIAIASCATVQAIMGWEPKVAMLSYSTDGSAESAMVDKMREAVRIAKEKRPDLKIDGEFQLDAAINPAVAAKKVKRPSDVAGHANILIWPDLNVGNIGVKLIQQFAHGDAYGPMLQGFAKPVSDCSRGAPVTELMGNILMLAAVAAHQ
ncbi:MAG: phosphate acetyltransferase [Oscillospiraceae bacterium]|nr:phosphate acetyltransferase [Oscillospiraceae bacterium]